MMREPEVLFGGSPVWMVNLPFLLGRAVIAVVFVGTAAVAAHGGIPFAWPFTCICLSILGLTALYRIVETRMVTVVVDSERMTYSRGVFTRMTGSVELYRIQTVECTSVLWQRLLGFGTLIVYSSDVNHPRWEIPGVRDLDARRLLLNRAAISSRHAKGIREFNMGRV
ncbi:PH domain-containing protein [Burkholderia vietnamiensis]|uniref:PH domain-containing protein n=1 Tax=Burkholderia vietnamiensis TaxID=60552 RepID=UPI001CF447BE|nr:PH domain-containing protein [Burkholderia vietnamiensis]MCA8228253.1 PH domain-containing protein [Burkholderia vietnamiensis]